MVGGKILATAVVEVTRLVCRWVKLPRVVAVDIEPEEEELWVVATLGAGGPAGA